MNARTHLRNAGIAALAILIILTLAVQNHPLPVLAQATVGVSPSEDTLTLAAGTGGTFTFEVTNNSGVDRTFNATFSNVPSGFQATSAGSVLITDGSTQDMRVQIVSTENDQAPGSYGPITITFSGTASGETTVTGSALLNIIVAGATFTPTPTLTSTPAPATNTPTRGPVCSDGFEPDDDPGAAKVIDANTAQERAICPAGDEDWLLFGGVGGKVYTIDVSRMDPGLDLSLEIFDSDLNSIAFNDDFYNRDPANPNPGDTRPQITIRIPTDGQYYIKVRDNAVRGGVDYIYVISLLSESYGPTPTLVREVCLDLFEPDGLPEQASLITSNEIQQERRLCPSGDADWITFFGKTGKRYIIYTDSRRYRGPNEVNGETQAGADTVIYLTDRDGVSILDFNDDIPGGNTLDSQVEFIPEVDGFYYLQVKNVGDIGNQFIRYDLVLVLCLPGQTDCGRVSAPAPGLPADPITPAATGTPADEFVIDPSPEPTSTPTSGTASAPGNTTAASNVDFASVAFRQAWERNDLPVAARQVVRSWLWGPETLAILREPFTDAQNGTRLVQYFEKARMEVASTGSTLTNGLLARELISGQVQVGSDTFEQRAPARIVIAGDASDPQAPTYASLQDLLNEPFPERIGQDVRETIDRAGRITRYSGPLRAEARLVHYVPETGHNIAAIFWQFFNQEGMVFEDDRLQRGALFDWVATTGLPITEPYWVQVEVDGTARDVLIQAFERRILTYTPDNPPGWQVEMGNVGSHYYTWRYGTDQ
jgi:hypothetical protein